MQMGLGLLDAQHRVRDLTSRKLARESELEQREVEDIQAALAGGRQWTLGCAVDKEPEASQDPQWFRGREAERRLQCLLRSDEPLGLVGDVLPQVGHRLQIRKDLIGGGQ